MKINHSHSRFISNNPYKTQEQREQTTNIKKEKNINIEISDSAKSLAQKINQAEGSKYGEKVEEIRKAILEGSYKVSPDKIADKIMNAIKNQKESGNNE
ncbi:FlgM family anti-sigma-28 factor [Alkalibaculum bacchi]|uniref:Negative regulator of flagellin synthesis n=1 Tax=Alkalibaculum bacchi TaxID=645887 RepID=A0A366IG53_9FIRM|nr:flagellar biosynthesis anti-sigma factor FlgM [Alkalibaculum bacchi]RBP70127.1 FlgM family anti-sigma-28 factor [Alkalibaculum bacchi]